MGAGALEDRRSRAVGSSIRPQVPPGEVPAADAERERRADRYADEGMYETELDALQEPLPLRPTFGTEPEYALLGLGEQRQRGDEHDDEAQRTQPLERGAGRAFGVAGHGVAHTAERRPPPEAEQRDLQEH